MLRLDAQGALPLRNGGVDFAAHCMRETQEIQRIDVERIANEDPAAQLGGLLGLSSG